MGDKGAGGAPDTSGLERATAESTALQREIYEQTREDQMPWYNVGSAGVGRLGELLGLSGGGGALDRAQIREELLPQYTTQRQVGGATGGNLYVDASGNITSLSSSRLTNDDDDFRRVTNELYQPAASYEDSVDYNALNAAIEDRLAGQETPEGFGSLLERFDLDKFEEDPSYQFRQQESNKALERALAAQGVTLGGAGFGDVNQQAARALQEQNQNLASQEYGAAYGRYNADQQNVFNRLMGVSGMGQNTTGQLQQAGQNYATNVGNLNTSLAGAQYQAQQAAASEPSMFSQVLGTAAQVAPYVSMFSDERLKENIEYIGKENGHNIYEFDYRDGSGRYRGVMAQDVIKDEPSAVITHPNGYMMVDYGKIGIEMERV